MRTPSALLALLSLAGCSSPEPVCLDSLCVAYPDAAQTSDAARDASDGSSCPAGQGFCGSPGACAPLSLADNCGRCGNPCTASQECALGDAGTYACVPRS